LLCTVISKAAGLDDYGAQLSEAAAACVAYDLETGAVDVRHPELLPQRSRNR
jgi:hypothetical protein